MELSEHIQLNRAFAEAICEKLYAEIIKLGFAESEIT